MLIGEAVSAFRKGNLVPPELAGVLLVVIGLVALVGLILSWRWEKLAGAMLELRWQQPWVPTSPSTPAETTSWPGQWSGYRFSFPGCSSLMPGGFQGKLARLKTKLPSLTLKRGGHRGKSHKSPHLYAEKALQWCGLHRISLTLRSKKLRLMTGDNRRAVSAPCPVPATEITSSPVRTSPLSAAIRVTSQATFTP